MPKRKKGKKKKPARSAAAKSMLKKSDFYPDMGPIIKSFDEREKTRAKGPEELPHGSLDIPLWLAYYDELYVLNKGSGGKGMMEARDYLEKVVPSQKYLPDQLRIKTSKEGRREAVRSRQPLPCHPRSGRGPLRRGSMPWPKREGLPPSPAARRMIGCPHGLIWMRLRRASLLALTPASFKAG